MTKGRRGVRSHVFLLHTANQACMVRMVPQLTLNPVSAGPHSSLAAQLFAEICRGVLVDWGGRVDRIDGYPLDLLRIPEFCSRQAICHSYSSE